MSHMFFAPDLSGSAVCLTYTSLHLNTSWPTREICSDRIQHQSKDTELILATSLY